MPTSTHPVQFPPTLVHAYTPECLHFPPAQLSTLNVQSAGSSNIPISLLYVLQWDNSYVYTSRSNTHLYILILFYFCTLWIAIAKRLGIISRRILSKCSPLSLLLLIPSNYIEPSTQSDHVAKRCLPKHWEKHMSHYILTLCSNKYTC